MTDVRWRCGRAALISFVAATLSATGCGGGGNGPGVGGVSSGNGGTSGAGMGGLGGAAGDAGSGGTSGDGGAGGSGGSSGVGGAIPNEPTYTVVIHGAVLAPWDDRGDAWDGPDTVVQQGQDDLRLAETDYSTALAFVEANQTGWESPEVYGDARLSIGTYDEVPITLKSAASAESTMLPVWTDAAWKHVPLVETLRLLIALYDADASTPDAVSYILLTANDLIAVSQIDGVAALPVYNRTGSRVLWLELEVLAEEPDQSGYAPSAVDDDDINGDASKLSLPTEPTTLWLHGLDFWGGTDVVLPWGDPFYWSKDGVDLTGPNATAINYHARAYVNVSNVVLLYALERYCLGSGACVLACHSAGCAHAGFGLAEFGVEGTRWSVDRIVAGGSAAGGSELASLSSFTGIVGFLGRDLAVGRMRDLYDHDALGVQVDSSVGANGDARSAFLPGEDDDAVAYHSAGGAREDLAYCNTNELFCDAVLPLNTFAPELFARHRVVFRDDAVEFNHRTIKERIASWVASEFPSQ